MQATLCDFKLEDGSLCKEEGAKTYKLVRPGRGSTLAEETLHAHLCDKHGALCEDTFFSAPSVARADTTFNAIGAGELIEPSEAIVDPQFLRATEQVQAMHDELADDLRGVLNV